MTESDHSRLSPSAAHRWLECPGSINLIERLEIQEQESEPARIGTEAHKELEQCLNSGRHSDHEEYGEAVNTAIEYVEKVFTAHETAQDLGGIDKSIIDIVSEMKTDTKFLGIEGLDGGTADIVLFFREDDMFSNFTMIELIDYKHGEGVYVEVDDNPQLLLYAVGVINEYQNNLDPDTKIILTVVQPNFQGGGSDPIRSKTYTVEQILQWQEETLIPKAKAVLDENAPLTPKEDACRFCDAKAHCPANAELMLELAQHDFDDPDGLTDDQKVRIMEIVPFVSGFIKAVTEVVTQEMIEGSEIYNGSHKLVYKRTRSTWADDAEAKMKNKRVPASVMYKKTLDTRTAVKKFLTEKYDKKKAEQMIADWSFTPPKQLTIAPVSDSRKAIKPTESAKDDFADIEEETDGS